MAGGDFEYGLDRVRNREMNNRRSSRAKGPAAKTPQHRGATRGFASNALKNGGIAVKRRGNR